MFELFEIMDEMCEMIYVADINTYELFFVNSQGKKMFQLKDDCIGQKCYRILQGRDEPCPFCTNDLLTDNKVYSWEIYNPLLKRHYVLKDKLIEWNGKPARIEIAIDTTKSENEKLRLQNAVESERITMDCIRILYQCSALEKTIPEILQKVCHFLKAKRTYYIEILDGHTYNAYEWCAQNGISQQKYWEHIDENHVMAWLSAINKHECYVVHNVENLQETHTEIYNLLKLQNINALAIAPLEQDGKVVAYIGVDNPPQEMIDSSSMLFYTLRYFLMAAIRRETDEKLLTQLSYHDSLTGSYNRNRYIKDIHELHMNNIPLGIVYLDINGLKTINDQMGHAAGDKVIRMFANTVAEVFGLSQLYRLGGDEFVVLCKNVLKEEFFRLLSKLEKKFEALDSYSAALGHHWTDSSWELAQNVSSADAMMYENKKKHYRGMEKNNRYRYMNDDIFRLGDPDVLQADLDENRFLVFLQPKVIMETRELVGAEALVRYQDRDGTIILPDQFLPLLERSNIVGALDFYMLDKVCAIIAQWIKNGEKIVPVSVNFSRNTVSDVRFTERVNDICKKHGVDRSYLKIEIANASNFQVPSGNNSPPL